MICKTCKFWGSENDRNGFGGSKICTKIKMLDYYKQLELGKVEPENPYEWNSKEWHLYSKSQEYVDALAKAKEKTDKDCKEYMDSIGAYTEDGSMYWAGIYTAKHFGCALWEKNY